VIWAGQAIAVTVLMLMAYRPCQAKPMNAAAPSRWLARRDPGNCRRAVGSAFGTQITRYGEPEQSSFTGRVASRTAGVRALTKS